MTVSKCVCVMWGVAVAGVATWSMADAPEVTPSLHAYGVVGVSSADDPAAFAPGGHDPNRDGAPQLQSFEPGLSLRWGEHLQGFATGTTYSDLQDDFQWEWEEYFLKLTNLPGGIELRGGRMLNRVGVHNPTHLHSWTTVDAPLPHALFLGEDGLSTKSGEVNFYVGDRNPLVLTFSFGQRPDHSHAHGHVEEEAHEHEEEDHHHEEEEGHHHEEEEAHGHEGHDHGEGFQQLEAFRVQDDVFTAGLRKDVVLDDFNRWTFAGFGGTGDTEEGEDAWFAGLGVEYQWRENGLEPGGRALRWRTEVIRFAGKGHAEHGHEEEHGEHEDEDHHEEEHAHGDEHEEETFSVSGQGISTELLYEATPHVHPFGRIDAIASVDALDLPSWIRYSAGVVFPLNHDPGLYIRVQANADDRGDEQEQSAWVQLGFSWGGPEVR